MVKKQHEPLPGFITSVFSLYIFVIFTQLVFAGMLDTVDAIVSEFLFSIRSGVLTDFFTGISFIGGEFLPYFTVISALILLIIGKGKRTLLLTTSMVVAFILVLLLKSHFGRSRPVMDSLQLLNSHSYPSAHAMGSFIFYSLVYYFSRYRVVGLVCMLVTLLVGISRIYLGVHYPTDVVGGYIAGFWVVTTVLLLKNLLK